MPLAAVIRTVEEQPAAAAPAGSQADAPLPLPEPLPGLVRLSPRERRIVALFAQDYTNKEAARELGIHPETVKTHVRRIYAKLGVRSKAGCVAMALRGLGS